MRKIIIILMLSVVLISCAMEQKDIVKDDLIDEVETMPKKTEKATFAGGCFWCMEAAFQTLDGVVDVISGYTGGEKENPTYQEVSSGETGHYESIEVTYDPTKISYDELLDFFWKNIDPIDDTGQFVDKGSQYRSAIFYHNESQRKKAEKSKEDLASEFDEPIVTEVLPASTFYKAEEYHQDYSDKRTVQYKLYEMGSGRKKRLKELWQT